MEGYKKSIIPLIEAMNSNFTATEKLIAEFFINNLDKDHLNIEAVSKKIFVSKASLSRFAKKCGFKGYREFIYIYELSLNEEKEPMDKLKKEVLSTYQRLLDRSYTLIDEEQIKGLSKMLMSHKKVYVYGIGSSGLAAREFKIRFMRLGMNVEAITDEQTMLMNKVVVDEGSLVIGLTVSGKTKTILKGLRDAEKKGASTVIITSSNNYSFKEYCQEVVLIAVTKNLHIGNVISPQFPILIVLDILYSHFLNSDYKGKLAKLQDTLKDIEYEIEK